jgi:hypothetical protein
MLQRLVGVAIVLAVALLSLEASGPRGAAVLGPREALQRARADGFRNARLGPRPTSFRCDTGAILVGTAVPPGRFRGYHRARFMLLFDDRRIPPEGHVAMLVAVFAQRGLAVRCRRLGLAAARHRPANALAPNAPTLPFRAIGRSTVETHMHAPSSGPGVIPGSTGVFETFVARGPVLAYGVAWNPRESAMVRADLTRVVLQVTGAG